MNWIRFLNKENVMSIPKISDFMTKDVITASFDYPMRFLIERLLKNDVSGAPVVDGEMNIVGLISGKDVLKGLSVDTFHRLGTGVVENYMSTDVFTIRQDVDIFTASSIFYDTNYRRIPVVDDCNKLVGIVTRKDVIKALDQLKNDKIAEHVQKKEEERLVRESEKEEEEGEDKKLCE
jgi:predicted transcriptional regulator